MFNSYFCVCKQALGWLRELKKSDFMMLCDCSCNIALEATIDQCEAALQSMPLPYSSKLGPLLSSLLAAARFWVSFAVGAAEAAKQMLVGCAKSANKPPPSKDVMALAPWTQLLENEQQTEVKKWISDLSKQPAALKRLGSKASLGLLKAKASKVIAKASVSSSSGASLKLDLFDF